MARFSMRNVKVKIERGWERKEKGQSERHRAVVEGNR